MSNRVIQCAIECPKFTTIGVLYFGFDRGANQLVELLTLPLVLAQKLSQCLRVRQQPLAPLFRLVMMPFFIGVHALHGIELCLQSVGWRQPHAFPNELQLPPPRFVLFCRHGAIEGDRLGQSFIGKLDALKLFVGKCCKALTQGLQRGHFAFDGTFGRAFERLFGIDIVFFKGASVCHDYRV